MICWKCSSVHRAHNKKYRKQEKDFFWSSVVPLDVLDWMNFIASPTRRPSARHHYQSHSSWQHFLQQVLKPNCISSEHIWLFRNGWEGPCKPTNYGWKIEDILTPVDTDGPIAPDNLFNMISCGCKAYGCRMSCGWRKIGYIALLYILWKFHVISIDYPWSHFQRSMAYQGHQRLDPKFLHIWKWSYGVLQNLLKIYYLVMAISVELLKIKNNSC